MNTFRMRRSRLLVAAGAVAASCLVAAPAQAGTLTVDYGKGVVAYVANAGENNDFQIAAYPGNYRMQDSAIANVGLSQIGGPSACGVLEPWRYKCASAGIASVGVTLGDGTDKVDLTQVAVPVTVAAGAGSKTISTGSGNDQIDVRNGSADTVSCGAGDDSVLADPGDSIASDCEHVDLTGGTPVTAVPEPTAAGAHGTGGPPNPAPAPPVGGDGDVFKTPIGLTLPASTVALVKPHVAVVPIACAADATDGCRGDIVFEALSPKSQRTVTNRLGVTAARGHYVAQQRSKTRRIGKRSFKLAAGQSAKLPVRIAYRGHFEIASRRRRRRAVMKVVERDSSGKVVDTQTRVVTLRPRTNKWSRLRRHHH